MTKPPTCCDRWRGKPISSLVSATSRTITGLSGAKPASRIRSGMHLAAVPPREHAGEPVDLREIEAQRLADVAHRALRPVGDQRRGERRAVAAVLRVDVLDDFLAPLVLEVDVDVGRLVALLRDEALEQHAHARRVDLGDAERIADGRVGRRAAALAEDAPRARERDDVVDGEEVGLVFQLRDQRELVLDQLADVGGNVGEVGSDSTFPETPLDAAMLQENSSLTPLSQASALHTAAPIPPR